MPGSGFDLGFEEFKLVRPSRRPDLDPEKRSDRLRVAAQVARGRADDGAARALDILKSWVEEPKDRPFFWFVNLVEAHSPYLPPKPFNSLGITERIRSLDDVRRFQNLSTIWKSNVAGIDLPSGSLERMRALYKDSIRQLDDWVGKLLDLVQGARLLEDTLVVITSDHGENLGENGMLGHSFSLDDRLLRVPLVSAGPVRLTATDATTSLVNFPRLLANAIGLANHPWTESVLPPGLALAQVDPPTGPEDPRVQLALEIWGLDAGAVPAFTTKLSSASDSRFKLIRRGDVKDLFDTANDPLENRPLTPESPEELRALEILEAALSQADALEPEPPASDSASEAGEMTGDLEERMRLLGYF